MSCSFENYGAFFKSVGAFGEEQGSKKKNVCFYFSLFSPILVEKGGEMYEGYFGSPRVFYGGNL